MSSWVEELKESERLAAKANAVDAELAMYEERKYRELAPEWWSALVGQIQADAAQLGKNIRTKITTAPSIQLERNGSRLACIDVRLLTDAKKLRLSYSHSDNGFGLVPDGVEYLSVTMQGDLIVTYTQSGECFSLTEGVSGYLLKQLIGRSDSQIPSGGPRQWMG
ncbi:MAG TPA: hypothetical protein VGN17_02810 [Bryobacteraceae bacterium]|jgi:hypothetical protein